MKNSNSIFAVDVKGFRALQAGKPKWMIVRELIANALDENISKCAISFSYLSGKATIIVEDDSPEGFVDLSHAYTLFADTRKRSNPNVRGRFNLGEKQVICLSDYVRITSTKGGVEFRVLEGKRIMLRKKRDAGSEVMVVVKMDKAEYLECIEYCKQILSPKKFLVLNKTAIAGSESFEFHVECKAPYKTFTAKLKTELKDTESGDMKNVTRETEVNIHMKSATGGKTYIYELGIPICEIECDYSIDVQQKVPLSADRDKVEVPYLKALYGEVLNQMITEIKPEQASNIWVRTGFGSDRATKESRNSIIVKRFGDKALIENPFDPYAKDKAITDGYALVRNTDLSEDERNMIKQDGLLQTTTAMFGVNFVNAKRVSPDARQKNIADFCKRIAKEFQNIDLKVVFIDCPEADELATFNYPSNNELTFNAGRINDGWWEESNGCVGAEMLDLIIHELGHKGGWHYESGYHKELTYLGSRLTRKGLTNPMWFKLKAENPVAVG